MPVTLFICNLCERSPALPTRGGNAGVTISDVKLLLLLYAYDLVIFAESAEMLQEQINKLDMYCNGDYVWTLKNLKSWYLGEDQLLCEMIGIMVTAV